MNEELKLYLQKSKNERNKLKRLAKELGNSKAMNSNNGESNTIINFPEINPRRFKYFEQELNSELQSFFDLNSGNLSLIEKKSSLMYNKNSICSVYSCLKLKKTRPSILLPITRERQKSVPNRILGNKYIDNSVSSPPTITSNYSTKRPSLPKNNLQDRLFTPILKQKSANKK